jgi:uncharacterized membrane protein YqhA
MRQLFSRFSILGELLRFLWKRRLWWLIPMVLVLVLSMALFIFAQGSVIVPFIYSLF